MRRRARGYHAGAVAAALGLLLAGCSRLGYYRQALWGGARILMARQPVAKLLADPATPPELAERLRLAQSIREFAVSGLALPDNGSYRTYVALDRPYAVWNVVAAPELSVEPLTWCFPVAGCVSYRGYFSRRRAERFASELSGRGHDVDVGGVAAYSTLGRFRDPILSTFLGWPDADLAGLLIHELAHQRVYVPGDTPFNESFATTVELAGVERWLRARSRLDEAADVLERFRREEEVVALLLDARSRLAAAYAADESDDWKRLRKAELLEDLAQRYRELRAAGGGTAGYDRFFAERLDNARLAAIGAYHRWVPALQALLAERDGDLAAFYEAAGELAAPKP